jgi:hypothetical protein
MVRTSIVSVSGVIATFPSLGLIGVLLTHA